MVFFLPTSTPDFVKNSVALPSVKWLDIDFNTNKNTLVHLISVLRGRQSLFLVCIYSKFIKPQLRVENISLAFRWSTTAYARSIFLESNHHNLPVFFLKKQMLMMFGSRVRGVLLGTVIGLGLAGLLVVWNREDFYMKHQSVMSFNAGKGSKFYSLFNTTMTVVYSMLPAFCAF